MFWRTFLWYFESGTKAFFQPGNMPLTCHSFFRLKKQGRKHLLLPSLFQLSSSPKQLLILYKQFQNCLLLKNCRGENLLKIIYTCIQTKNRKETLSSHFSRAHFFRVKVDEVLPWESWSKAFRSVKNQIWLGNVWSLIDEELFLHNRDDHWTFISAIL